MKRNVVYEIVFPNDVEPTESQEEELRILIDQFTLKHYDKYSTIKAKIVFEGQ